MNALIRIGIVGYGNLGRGVEQAITKNPDTTLVGVFSRRDPSSITTVLPGTQVYALADAEKFKDEIDVMILCGGSKSDLEEQGPELAALFNTVDSFDTHARIPEYFASVDSPALAAENTSLISVGWDPGMFSINRVYAESILPAGESYTFWGRGVSQGHSDAIRRVPGVVGGVQYTVPSEEAIERVRAGEQPELTTRQKHVRECYVVLAEDADAEAVRAEIVGMPHYFDEYDTTVNFISAEELARDHAGIPHGGLVLRSGETSEGVSQLVEYRLALGSNPEFTASVLVAYARACYRLNSAGEYGAKTVFDVAPGLLSIKSAAELRAEQL